MLRPKHKSANRNAPGNVIQNVINELLQQSLNTKNDKIINKLRNLKLVSTMLKSLLQDLGERINKSH